MRRGIRVGHTALAMPPESDTKARHACKHRCYVYVLAHPVAFLPLPQSVTAWPTLAAALPRSSPAATKSAPHAEPRATTATDNATRATRANVETERAMATMKMEGRGRGGGE